MTLNIIILAAGQGTRMHSALPKVLNPIGGVPILERVINTAQSFQPKNIFVVCGYGSSEIKERLKNYSITWVEQLEQSGTGHAVMQVLPHLHNAPEKVLILYGDVPLVTANTLQQLLTQTAINDLGLLTAVLNDPSGYGRIIRDQQGVRGIIEDKDADEQQRAITEINSGIMVTSVENLKRWLPQLTTDNIQQEYLLTDIVKLAVTEQKSITTMTTQSSEEIQGINNKIQLAQLERQYQKQLADKFMLAGVTLLDPLRFDVRGEAEISADVTIDINVILEGRVRIGKNTVIGANCILRNVTVAENTTIGANCVLINVTIGEKVEIKPHCHIEEAIIDNQCKVGPFARIRPGTTLAQFVSVGNFVEIKNSQIGSASKLPHLSYIGDTTMGQQVNVGAGTITCNYDGANKHRTTIGNNVFIGSDTQFVAPITIADGATIGAGSTITKDAPAEQLTLSRAPQKSIVGWQRPVKKDKPTEKK